MKNAQVVRSCNERLLRVFAGYKHKKAKWKTSVFWLSYVLASSANDCPPNTPSLHHRCNLTLVHNICEAVLISLLTHCPPHRPAQAIYNTP